MSHWCADLKVFFNCLRLAVAVLCLDGCALKSEEESTMKASAQTKANISNGNFGVLTRRAIKGRYICFARNLWKSDRAEFAETGRTRSEATSNALTACGGTHGNNTNTPTGAMGCVINACYDLQLRGAGQVRPNPSGWICTVSTRPSSIQFRFDPSLLTFVGEGRTIKEAYDQAEEICKDSAGIRCSRDPGCVDRSNAKLGRGTP
jgi:hypothetical protein